jgi:hypothetical protein
LMQAHWRQRGQERPAKTRAALQREACDSSHYCQGHGMVSTIEF